ncbi:hypothetical protein BS78_10G025000 [Paspalum vaginatum]|nr:hypothetical protein BS78_10G025000 [Paspalum vaginatum]
MDRILAMSLVGPGPGNVFGPGMSAGALESFARGRRASRVEPRNSRGGVASAAGTGSPPVPGTGGAGWKCAAEGTTGEGDAKGAGVQEGRGADANVSSLLGEGFCCEAVAPH